MLRRPFNVKSKGEKGRQRNFGRKQRPNIASCPDSKSQNPQFQFEMPTIAVFRMKKPKETSCSQRAPPEPEPLLPFVFQASSGGGNGGQNSNGKNYNRDVEPMQLRRSTRLNPIVTKQSTAVPSGVKRREEPPGTKSIFNNIHNKYNRQIKRMRSGASHSQSDISLIHNLYTSINDDFNEELYKEVRINRLKRQELKITMSIEEKIKQINAIFKGKTTPVTNRPVLKRKQQENQEPEPSPRLFTPSKYVYSTPENQKYRPNLHMDNSSTLVPAVYQTNQRVKVLYDIDQNAAKGALKPGAKVDIDDRFLKPICTSATHENEPNQFFKMPYEYTMNLTEEINAMNLNKNLNYGDPQDSATFDLSTDNFTIPIQDLTSDEAVMDITFRQMPDSNKYVPMTIEQEMAVKCSVRPAKIPRMTFQRSNSRKSLNFESSPSSSSPKGIFFDFDEEPARPRRLQGTPFARFRSEELFQDEDEDIPDEMPLGF